MSVFRDSKALWPRGLLMTRRGMKMDSTSRSHRRLMCQQARNFGPRVGSRKTLRSSVEHIGFPVKRRDQPVDSLVFQDSAEFGVAGRYLADCAVKVDIRDQPCIALAPHQVIDIDWLTISFDDLALDHDTSSSWPFSRDLQLLPAVAVETIGIDGGDVMPEAVDNLLPLRL